MVLKFTKVTKGVAEDTAKLHEQARILWLKEVQAKLQSDKRFKTWSCDEDDLWRCEGRMSKSELSLTARAPSLLDQGHCFTKCRQPTEECFTMD